MTGRLACTELMELCPAPMHAGLTCRQAADWGRPVRRVIENDSLAQARPEAAILGAPSDVRGGFDDPSCTMELDLAQVRPLSLSGEHKSVLRS